MDILDSVGAPLALTQVWGKERGGEGQIFPS